MREKPGVSPRLLITMSIVISLALLFGWAFCATPTQAAPAAPTATPPSCGQIMPSDFYDGGVEWYVCNNRDVPTGTLPYPGQVEMVRDNVLTIYTDWSSANNAIGSQSASLYFRPREWFTPTAGPSPTGTATVTPTATPTPNPMPDNWWVGGIPWAVNTNHTNIPTGTFEFIGHAILQMDEQDEQMLYNWDEVHNALGDNGTGTLYWYPGAWYTPTPTGSVTATPETTATPSNETRQIYLPLVQRTVVMVNAPENFCLGGVPYTIKLGEVLQSIPPCEIGTGEFRLDLDGQDQLKSRSWSTILIWADGKPNTAWFRPDSWGLHHRGR